MDNSLLEIRITRNDTGKLLNATKHIGNNLHEALEKVGKMWLRNAQEAMDLQGPGWKQHADSTVKRWGDYALLHTRQRKPIGGRHYLNRIKNHYGYNVSNMGKSAVLRIVPKSSFAAEMLFIHNRPMGDVNANNIPGRPYFKWRTGHFAESEERQSRAILRKYISDSLKKYGLSVSGLSIDLYEAGYDSFDFGGE